ncbi:MAG: response regulator [Gammaproteobacteria bacterium]|nr:response regulator [Gammaproteobacteria bacterium]
MLKSIKNKPRILFVDDSKTVRASGVKILSEDYDVFQASNGSEAWEILQIDQGFDVIFADIQMPEMNGLQFLRKVRSIEDYRTAQLPVIMITGHSDSHAAMRAVFEMGATGFISKPFSDIDLISRAHSYLDLTRKMEQLEELKGVDRLTGLCNYNSFDEHGRKTLSISMRHDLDLTVVYLELNAFTEIKSEIGRKAAEKIIISVANKLEGILRDEEVIARISESKFALLMPMTNRIKAQTAVNRLQNHINAMVFNKGDSKIHLNIVAGLTGTGFNNRGLSFDMLCMRADNALKSAISNNDAQAFDYYDDQPAKAVKEIPQEDILSDALLHIIDGNYNKVNDNDLSAIIDQLEPFMEYASIRTSMKTGYK